MSRKGLEAFVGYCEVLCRSVAFVSKMSVQFSSRTGPYVLPSAMQAHMHHLTQLHEYQSTRP